MQFRYAIELAYNGSQYAGWQIQLNASTIQEEIEQKIARLLRNQSALVVGCGRTDAGVHAHYFVAHVDLPSEIETQVFVYKLNKMLSENIVVFAMQLIDNNFHARFSAVKRTYRYFIHQDKNPFLPNSSFVKGDLDFKKMNEAAVHLLGRQDFTSFSKLHTDVKTNICTVYNAEWKQTSSQWYFEISADRFLRNMVRATVGTLLDVGSGKLDPSAIPIILAAKDRGAASLSVPANGLFLWKIDYPTELFTPRQ
jgi:tRNA pseudouridine38-40 synthase